MRPSETRLKCALKEREFVRFLLEQARIIHGIATFLLAHLDFGEEGLADRAVELAKNTLAYFLADERRRGEIEMVFRQVACSQAPPRRTYAWPSGDHHWHQDRWRR